MGDTVIFKFMSQFNNYEANLFVAEGYEFSYPVFYQPTFSVLEDGWTAFNLETEFAKLIQKKEWRISTANKEFKVLTDIRCVSKLSDLPFQGE